MAQIKLKNSVTPGSVPAGLSFGEVAVNITDKKIFIGNAVDATVTIYDPNLHVLSLNGLTGAVGLTSNSNITISQSGNTITFVGLTAHGRTGSVQFNNGSGGLTSSTSIEFSQTNNQFSITGATFRVGSATRGTQIYTSGVNNYIKAINGFLIIDSSASGVGIGDYLSGVCGTSILIDSTSVDTITLRGSKTEITGNLGVSGNVYAPNIVNSVNGQTGDVTITASGGVTGIVAGSGISVSGQTGNVTISNNGVLSIDGSTGAITNVAKTNAAQTFTPYQQFDGGVRVSGGLTADTLRCGAGFFSNAVSLTDSTKLLTVAGGISANNLRIDGGATFNSIAYFGSTFTVDNSAGLATFRRIAYFGSDSGTLRIVHADAFASEYNANIVGNGSAVADTTHTLPATTGTLLNTNSSYVSSVNGQTGAVTIATGLSWSAVTADRSLVAEEGVLANKSSGTLTLTLPTTAALGKVIRVSGMQNTWRIAQNASQKIHFGKVTTTTGVGGYLESSNAKDAVELVCCVANLEWNVISSIGNITIV